MVSDHPRPGLLLFPQNNRMVLFAKLNFNTMPLVFLGQKPQVVFLGPNLGQLSWQVTRSTATMAREVCCASATKETWMALPPWSLRLEVWWKDDSSLPWDG